MPLILRRLESGAELHDVAAEVSQSTGVSSLTSYKWVHEVDRIIQSRRKGYAIAGAACVWASVIFAALAFLLPFVFEVEVLLGIPSTVAGVSAAVLCAVPAIVLTTGSKRLAFRRGVDLS
jgi:VIT1/CCC1 family predicted Fe2+/Mn2+ transporter